MNRHFALAGAIASFAVIGATAPLDPDPDTLEVRSETVPYDRAEIRDGKSAEKLFFRIRQTAEEVCRIAPNPRGYEIWHEHDCEARAVTEAVRNADLPALDEYYFEDVGEAMPTWR